MTPDRAAGTAAPAPSTEVGITAPAPLAAELRTGTTVAGYTLEEVIGRGGMAVVYRGSHAHLGRRAAIKLLVPDLASRADFRDRFVRESRLAASLQHPNIVTVYDAGEFEDFLYIAMQYVDGDDLGEVLAREGALEPERALWLLGQVADALDAAHEAGLVHRDVKPGNVLVDERRAYLSDFGLTRLVSSQTALTTHGEFVGTIDYVPPEQIEGLPLDGRADVYALGCMLYHLLAGSVPFPKDSQMAVLYAHVRDDPPPVTAVRPDLPLALDGVLAKAMAKRRDDRYPHATEVVAAARAALGLSTGGPGTPAPPPAAVRRTILVAAADPALRALTEVSLDRARFSLFTGEDAEAVVELARRHPPELVFLDSHLPGASTGDVCGAVRAAAGAAGTKIVVMTGRRDAAAAAATGADAVMPRPFSSLQLLNRVRELLGADVSAG